MDSECNGTCPVCREKMFADDFGDKHVPDSYEDYADLAPKPKSGKLCMKKQTRLERGLGQSGLRSQRERRDQRGRRDGRGRRDRRRRDRGGWWERSDRHRNRDERRKRRRNRYDDHDNRNNVEHGYNYERHGEYYN